MFVNKTLESGNVVRFIADEVARERTGIHAKVTLGMDTTVLFWSRMNVDKDEDRTRAINSAHKMMPKITQEMYPKEDFKHDLDMFCRNFWTDHLGTMEAESLEGHQGDPPKMIVPSYVIEGGGTILFTLPGMGKSFTAILMAVSVDSGTTHLWQVRQAKTMLVNLERSRQSIQHRIGCINTALGVEPHRPLLTMNARGKSLTDIKEAVAFNIERFGIEFLVLDSISRAGFGDLTENAPVNKIVDTMNGYGVSWLGIAHSPRGDTSHVYGSVHFDAGADIMVQQSAEQKDNSLGIGLKVVKANDTAKPPMEILAYEFNEFGLKAARSAHKTEFPMLSSSGGTLAERLIEWGEAQGDFYQSEAVQAMGVNAGNVSSLLNNSGDYELVDKDRGKNKWRVRSVR